MTQYLLLFRRCWGVCLLVSAGGQALPVVCRALGFGPVVFLGQVSYSLYLWHWPVLVFPRYYLVRELTIPESMIAFMFMLAFAVASWRWVERPFRDGTLDLRHVLGITFAGSAVSAAVACAVLLTGGLPGRLSADAARINVAVASDFRCAVTDYKPFGKSRACALNLPTGDVNDSGLVLFGNSHAQMYAPLVTDLARDQQLPALMVWMSGCMPTLVINLDDGCATMARGNLEAILALPKVKLVVIGLNWDVSGKALIRADDAIVAAADDHHSLIDALEDVIGRIETSGRKVVLIGPIKTPGWDIASTASRELAFGWPQSRPDHVSLKIFETLHSAEIAHFSQRLGSNFLRPDKVLCDLKACRFIINGHSIFADSNHIAKGELSRFRDVFAPLSRAITAVK